MSAEPLPLDKLAWAGPPCPASSEPRGGQSPRPQEWPRAESNALGDFARAMTPAKPLTRPRIEIKQNDVKNGLGKLVLTLVELIRELLERQAIRRIEAGSLTDAEIERLGSTFLQLSNQMSQLKEQFGLTDDDLNLDLGPLGRLL